MIGERPAHAGRAAVVALLLLTLAPSLGAHSGILYQIETVSAAIARDPGNADLRLRRASLHRQQQMWLEALDDLRMARSFTVGLPGIERLMGEVLLDAGRLDEACSVLDRYLNDRPRDGTALVARARAAVRLGHFEAAARDFARAIDAVVPPQRPRPGLYLGQARALSVLGDEGVASALNILEEGIVRLGPLIMLQVETIDLEMRLGNTDGALGRLADVASGSTRKESWHLRRAGILEQVGRLEEAREAYLLARGAIAELPATRRGTPDVAALERRIDEGLERMATGAPAGKSPGESR